MANIKLFLKLYTFVAYFTTSEPDTIVSLDMSDSIVDVDLLESVLIEWGDGATSSFDTLQVVPIDHDYVIDGTYTIILTLTDKNGRSVSYTQVFTTTSGFTYTFPFTLS